MDRISLPVQTENHSRFGRTYEDRLVVAGWLGARALFGVGYFTSRVLVDRLGVARPIQIQQGLLAWDGTIYVDISRYGYSGAGSSSVRFFPLFSLIADAFNLLGVPPQVTLVLVSNLTGLAAALVATRVVRGLGCAESTAGLVGLVVAAGPTSFVTVLAYSDGLFLLACASCWLACQRDRPELAALAGLAAATCRPLGVLLIVPMLVETMRDPTRRTRPSWWSASLAPGIGLVSVMAWTRIAFHDWFAPFNRQTGLRGDMSNPIRVAVDHYQDLFGRDPSGDGLHAITFTAMAVVVVFVYKRLPLGWSLFGVIHLVVFMTAPNLNSIERYGAGVLPMVIGGVMIMETCLRPEHVRVAVMSASAGLGCLLVVLTFTGSYVP